MRIEMKILDKEYYGQDYESRLPKYATQGSAAIDLVCTEDVTLFPGETKMIPTGLAIWIGGQEAGLGIINVRENGCTTGILQRISIAGLILPRSGLGTKGLILANTVGLIDSDFQGELMVSAWNRNPGVYLHKSHGLTGDIKPIQLKAGDRFAQLLIIPAIKAQFDIVEEFSSTTQRNTGGFGSTSR